MTCTERWAVVRLQLQATVCLTVPPRSCSTAVGLELRLSPAVISNFFSLYHFFCVTSSIIHSLLFHLPQRFPLYSLTIPHYNYKISLTNTTHHLLPFFLHLLKTHRINKQWEGESRTHAVCSVFLFSSAAWRGLQGTALRAQGRPCSRHTRGGGGRAATAAVSLRSQAGCSGCRQPALTPCMAPVGDAPRPQRCPLQGPYRSVPFSLSRFSVSLFTLVHSYSSESTSNC
jgi:hypothetical protein